MLLLSAFNEAQAPLGELTAPLMEAYARRHKLGFRCVRFSEPNIKEAYWKKITLTLEAFDEGFDRVFWLDADQAITNPEIPPPECYNEFCAPMDWGRDAEECLDFSMCAFITKTRAPFEWVQSHKSEYIDGDFPEQTPMRKFFRENESWFWGLLRKEANAVPDEVCPGKVPEPWQPGDFAAHLTHISLVDRVALFHSIMARIK